MCCDHVNGCRFGCVCCRRLRDGMWWPACDQLAELNPIWNKTWSSLSQLCGVFTSLSPKETSVCVCVCVCVWECCENKSKNASPVSVTHVKSEDLKLKTVKNFWAAHSKSNLKGRFWDSELKSESEFKMCDFQLRQEKSEIDRLHLRAGAPKNASFNIQVHDAAQQQKKKFLIKKPRGLYSSLHFFGEF